MVERGLTRISAWSLPGVAALALGLTACGNDDGSAFTTAADGIDSGFPTTADGTDGSDSEPDTGNDSGGIKLDIIEHDVPGHGHACTEGGGGGGLSDEAFSYIWVSNSPNGTVSKINTETGIEEGRYRAGPGTSDPSRTSVNLFGDAVVVDRAGGIAKIAVVEERCVDLNGNGVIDTSQGPNDVRAWGADECVLWHQQLPSGGLVTNQFGPRPVAWEGLGAKDCTKPRVWVGWRDSSMGHFRRINGETGEIEDSVSVPWPGNQWGPYGGATNQQGDFWVLGWQYGPLVRIDGTNLVPKVYQIPSPPGDTQWTYGMALDADGHPWIAGSATVYHFNPDTEQWSFISVPGANMRGMMIDAEGRAWIANNGASRLVEIDTISKTVANAAVPLPGAVTPVGVSIDSEGKVWVVDQGASLAFKVDPDTYQTLLTVSGLIQPYTYSDMTGAGLGLVTFPPPK
jgi:DNA-binding beta-propeller fold protein YncE